MASQLIMAGVVEAPFKVVAVGLLEKGWEAGSEGRRKMLSFLWPIGLFVLATD